MSVSKIGFLALVLLGSFAARADVSGKKCTTYDDAHSVVHVKADDEVTVFGCLGYVHGRDRAWQMDFLRRTAQGRRAEVVGTSAIRGDFLLRLINLVDLGKKIYADASPEMKAQLEAYSYGVNRGFADGGVAHSYEFRELGYAPEPWLPVDSVVLFLLQSLDQTRKGFQDDLLAASRKVQFGEQAEGLFALDGTPWNTSILKHGEYVIRPVSGGNKLTQPAPAAKKAGENVSSLQKELWTHLGEDLGLPDLTADYGSNNWAVSGARSETGNALFASDPHLALRHPPFWYWVHISGGEIEAMGGSVPGVPFIASGTNQHVAWAPTNSYLDVADVYSVPRSDLKTAKSEHPVIWFRFLKWFKLPFAFKSFQRTVKGWPVLPLPQKDVDGWKAKDHEIVLRWTGFDLKASDFEKEFAMMKSRSVEEMDENLSQLRVPSFNFVFADDHGKIGYRAIGLTPKRTLEKSPYGVPSLSLNDLPSWEPLSAYEMPHVLNPPRGYIATANNRQWMTDAKYFIGRSSSNGLRAFRIEELLEAKPKHSFDTFKKIQCDFQEVDARFLLPILLDGIRAKVAEKGAPLEMSALKELETWNLDTHIDCHACGIYRRWLVRLGEETGLDEMSFYRQHADAGLIYREFQATLGEVGWHAPDSGIISKNWGDLHVAYFPHLSGVTDFDTKDPLPTPGDFNTVSPGSSRWNADRGWFEQDSGSSHRLIVEMSQPVKVYLTPSGSNQDLERPDLRKPGSAWSEWGQCSYFPVEFPVQWGKLGARAVQITL